MVRSGPTPTASVLDGNGAIVIVLEDSLGGVPRMADIVSSGGLAAKNVGVERHGRRNGGPLVRHLPG